MLQYFNQTLSNRYILDTLLGANRWTTIKKMLDEETDPLIIMHINITEIVQWEC